MAVTAPVSLTKIHAEFGGSAAFSAYVRGGAYVPDGPSENASISTTTSGLAMSTFEGAINAVYGPMADFVWSNISGTNTASTVADSTTGYNTAVNLYYTSTYNSGSLATISYKIDSGSWISLLPSTNFSFPVGSTLSWKVDTSFSSVNVDIFVYNNSYSNEYVGGFNATVTNS